MSRQKSSPVKGSLKDELSSTSSANTTNDQNLKMGSKIMCSVLNVVIDHTMEQITAMEAEEWSVKKNIPIRNGDSDTREEKEEHDSKKQNDASLLVPVIRIFGPLLRDPHSQPLQSACLYIHGAFPYILARPVLAGPDGSIYPNPCTTTHVNWDNRDEVEAIQAEIQATLEETLQSSFSYDSSKEEGDHSDKDNRLGMVQCSVIRKVTVVEGRGFYTFCPGPSTSFLRIEYYDPKLRWKVKLTMERGLQLPRRYHPDLRRYDRPPNTIDDEANDLLRFNCYEAHIPYTMQFFKDHNLAGMTYIHIRNGKIRGNLPKRYYPRNKELHPDCTDRTGDNVRGYQDVFLQTNTHSKFLWPESSKSDNVHDRTKKARPRTKRHGQTLLDEDFSSFCHLQSDYSPPRKNSSCDVEIDCSVNDIQNIDNIMTSLPSNQEERDRIQWRAVPSLQEIWREERARMKKLLSPELTQEIVGDAILKKAFADGNSKSPEPTAFTLDVKKSASRSGTKLAVKGMWSLVNVSVGLQENFIRSLVDILERHKESIERADQGLKEGRTERIAAHTSEQKLVPNSPMLKDKTTEFLLQLATPSYNREQLPNAGRRSTPPTMKEAISALKALGASNHDNYYKSPVSHQPLDSDTMTTLRSVPTPNTSRSKDISLTQRSSVHKRSYYESPLQTRAGKEDTYQCEVTKTLNDPDLLVTRKSGDVYSQSTKGVRLFVEPSQPGRSMFEVDDEVNYTQDETQAFSEPLSYPCTQDMHVETLPTSLNPVEYSQRMERGDSILHTQDQDVEELINPETLAPYNHIVFGEDCCRAIFDVETDSPNMHRICGFRGALCPREGHEFAEKRAKPGMYTTITTGTVVDGVLDNVKYGSVGAGGIVDDGQEEDYNVLEEFCRRSQKSVDSQHEIKRQFTQVPIASRLASTLLTQAIEEESGTGESIFSDGVLNMQNKGLKNDGSPRRSQKRSLSKLLSQEEEAESDNSCFLEDDNDRVPSWLVRASNPDESNKDDQSSGNKTRKINRGKIYFEPKLLAPDCKDVKVWWTSQKKTKFVMDNKNEVSRKKRTYRVQEIRDYMVGRDQSDTCKILRKQQPFEMTPTQGAHPSDRELKRNENDTPGASSKESKSSQRARAQNEIQSESQESENALEGICNQGGRLFIQGGGGLKARTRDSNLAGFDQPSVTNATQGSKENTSFLASPITMLAVEVHVQCRVGASRLDSKKISMAQDSSKDRITAIIYVYARDKGGGESLEILSRGCLCLALEGENPGRDPNINKNIRLQLLRAMPRTSMGVRSPLSIDVVKDERHLLRRFKDIVRTKDPDLMMSWDTQGAGLGYIIERGHALGKIPSSGIAVGESNKGEATGLDMAKLLGRTPMDKKAANFVTTVSQGRAKGVNLDQINETNENAEQSWQGSGLGSDWDDRVGAGVAAASIIGRLVFAGWKIIAEEVKHPNASYLPAVVFAVLNKRIPHHDDLLLTKWYANSADRWRTLNYRLTQATASLLLFDALDIVGRAGEAARLSGVEFSQSFPGIRGSQYKVEGVLLRALKSLRSDERGSKKGRKLESDFSTQQTNYSSISGRTKSQSQSPWKVRRSNAESDKLHSLEDRQYFFFSPSQDDVKEQEALEVQALTLEPQSGHFTDPVVVCDFTALYPSLIIAYNLCYSTCAGKLDYHSTRREMQMEGRTREKVGPFAYCERRTATVLNHHLKSLSNVSQHDRSSREPDFSRDRAYVAPTGTVYVSESVLKGVLPQVLDEMLTTRAMLKKAAKEYKKNVKDLSPAILRQLEARQLALKYVANVTYGYTSATFSGRCAMPLLADTIVECGRRTLQRAMHIANQWGQGLDPWGKEDNNWLGAEVIYGDTDSLFIRMPGRSYKEAFDFGAKFCKAVTSLNPPPIQLKLEKVYLGSIMQTMKRYCGMKYDSKDQKKPTFEAKGLETIRRDQCALTQKVLKDALITLFKAGIEAVKEYMCRQWSLIFAGDLPVSDFILTGRVRTKYRGGKEGPVQAVLARRLAEADPGRVVRHKERIPYVIVATPGVTFRLKDCVLTPLELLERWDAYKIHSGYYIEKHVNAALQRCLGLPPHFVKVADWFATCPKPRRRTHFWPIKSKRAMITAYFGNDVCSLCQRKCQADGSSLVVVCKPCKRDRINSVQLASAAMNEIESEANIIAKKCSKCNGCFESAETFAVTTEQEQIHSPLNGVGVFQRQKNNQTLLMPLANCVCIDCPILYQRHRLKEKSIEVKGTYDALTADK